MAMEIQKSIEKTPYGQKYNDVVEKNGSIIHYIIDEEGDVTIERVFVQNQESNKLADLLTDYFANRL